MQGDMAKHYAYLMKRIWAGDAYVVSPSEFKWTIGKYAPQFSGYRQHDAQELLMFLLDLLHEDVNKVLK
jgi:ubiquitin carboxyl-terminal hydrolase 4/11/15